MNGPMKGPMKDPMKDDNMLRDRRQSGFTLIELMIVVAIALVLIGFALPSLLQTVRNLRISGDNQDISGEILMSKMRAAANFSASRVYFDKTAGTFVSQMWCRDVNSLCAAGDVNTWKDVSVDGPQHLSTGVSIGVGNQTLSPTGAAITTGQSCVAGGSGTSFATSAGGGSAIANTVCVLFNSRGFPVDNSGNAVASDAVYINDVDQIYGVTVSITGLTANWRHDRHDTSAAHWVQR